MNSELKGNGWAWPACSILLQETSMKRGWRQIHISTNDPLFFTGGWFKGLYLIMFVFTGEDLPVCISTQSIISSGETGVVWREARCSIWTARWYVAGTLTGIWAFGGLTSIIHLTGRLQRQDAHSCPYFESSSERKHLRLLRGKRANGEHYYSLWIEDSPQFTAESFNSL